MNEIPTKVLILDIVQNLARIGNWTADSYDEKKNLIEKFLVQTRVYVDDLSKRKLPKDLEKVFLRFKKEFGEINFKDIRNHREIIAEKFLTWANILQNRSLAI